MRVISGHFFAENCGKEAGSRGLGAGDMRLRAPAAQLAGPLAQQAVLPVRRSAVSVCVKVE